MLLIKTTLEINGASHLFASENIPKGAQVIKMESIISKSFYHAQIDRDGMVDFFSRYGFYDDKIGVWYLFGDNARFINHSSSPNIEKKGNFFIASKEIKSGEEIFIDYLKTCDWCRQHGIGAKRNIEVKTILHNDYPIKATITEKALWAFQQINAPSTVRDVYNYLGRFDNLFHSFTVSQYSALHIAISRIKNLRKKERKFAIFELK